MEVFVLRTHKTMNEAFALRAHSSFHKVYKAFCLQAVSLPHIFAVILRMSAHKEAGLKSQGGCFKNNNHSFNRTAYS